MKKLRGGKRRSRRLERLSSVLPGLDMKMLQANGEYSVFAHSINPFAIEPTRICSPEVQLILSEWLANLYMVWNKKLKKELGAEPYFLEVWLDAPSLAQARIICAKGPKIEECKSRLAGALDNQEFPYDEYVSEPLENLKWKQRQEPVVIMEKEFEELPHFYRMFEEMSYSKKKNEQGENYLLIPGRSFWVGTK
ncbi:MAG: hypothetical protein H7318_03420 [Oligoflexus sp.]|nr:hypothetical protein [Oligoflexus sp.]